MEEFNRRVIFLTDHRFNLGYGRQYTSGHPLIVAFRVSLDRETHRLADESQTDA